MKFTWYIAGKYFWSKKRESRFLSFIKIMAIGGVAIGSAGLLIALSIVHGFKSTINEKIVGFAPHVTVNTFMNDPLLRADTLQTYLADFEGVEEVQPVVLGQVMIQSAGDVSGMLIKGVPESGDVTQLRDYVVQGTYDLSLQQSGLPGIIIGQDLARTIDAEIGDKITVFALEGLPTPFNTPEIEQFTLTGIYQTGIDRFDDNFALTTSQPVRDLFGYNPQYASSMEINVTDEDQIVPVYSRIRDATQFPYVTESIYQRYRNIFAWIDLQEETIPLVISVMVIVAAFNLIGTVLMMVLERVKDIGILKTIGAKSRAVRQIFLLEGIFVAISGLVTGIVISLLFYWLQVTYQIIPLSEENYYMSYAPVEPHLLDFIIVGVVTLLLCALASWLPARIAAQTDPVKVLTFGK
ncbi:ABC transporter permease [Rhodohalobacter sulfatireducens]|uniref:ABC transporter permease n=1 Tax=Rhodohalobacter sulfatireducens TaxID=2911366 RepID=A0ABS9KE18_9BACT|nr:ABC transporter permease [Rhodohalobacter sulfatireducens]MCG2589104.1 ABC transporter permease [Rhodohalobacter sulfatireducens]